MLIWAHLSKMPTVQHSRLRDPSDVLRRFMSACILSWAVDANNCAQRLESRHLRAVDGSGPRYDIDSWYTFRTLGIESNTPGDTNMAGLAVNISREHIPMPALEHAVGEEVRIDATSLHVRKYRRSVFLQVHQHLTHPCFKIVCLSDRGEHTSFWSHLPFDCYMKTATSDALRPYYIFISIMEHQVEASKREWSYLLDMIDRQIGLKVSLLLCLLKPLSLKRPSVIETR